MVGVAKEAFWNDLKEFVLHRAGRLAGSDAEPVGDAKNVGVHSERRLAEGGVEHHARCLAANSRQRLERRAIVRNRTAMALHHCP